MFPIVAKEIWSIYDAALCYDSDPYSRDDEDAFFSDLRDMRMAVIVVTRRFLTESSFAKDVVMPFLASANLPMLPLMRESGLEQLFAEVMGELQYLAISSQNSSEIPYEEKLRTFLLKALPDGDTIDKIRQSFRSRIFLSYRKVDRKDARELIRFVHEIDECRDVAIWYDDFLTFGEDFNNEISDAIKESDLFAMAVTPNIVKDENYVIRKEYPLALEEKKSILPIEMHATNRTQLTESFKDIPDCVSYENAKELTETLRFAFNHSLDCQKNPEHDYLIGLAYLNGIDVETDLARGVSLIRSASDAGIVEACEKLVDIYWLGDGTPIDREKALLCQEKLIKLLEEKKEGSKRKDDALSYARALYKKATLLCELRRYREALPSARKARAVVDNLCTFKDSPMDVLLSKYAILCSEIHFKLHQDGRGMVFFVEAFAYMNFDAENMTDTKRQLVTFGLTLLNEEGYSGKKGSVDDFIYIAESTYEESGLEFDKEQYVRSLLLGVGLQKEKEKKIALAERVVELLESADKEQLSESMQNYLAKAYIRIGINMDDDNDKKRECFVKALEISSKHPESPRHREEAVYARSYLASFVYRTVGRTEQSNKLYEQAVKEIRELANETKYSEHYKLLFSLESLRDEKNSIDWVKIMKSQMNSWKSLCKQYPDTKEFKEEYTTAKRMYYICKVFSIFGAFKEEKK